MRKLILVASLFVTALGCGHQSESSVNGFPGFQVRPAQVIPSWGVNQVVKFARDQRPVDGNLVELILTKQANGSYDVTQHIVTAGFGSPSTDTTTDIAENLKCVNGFADEIGTLTDVICSRDMRPVDGALYRLAFTYNNDGGGFNAGHYDAVLVVTPSGRGGDSAPRTTELGTSLNLSIVDAGKAN